MRFVFSFFFGLLVGSFPAWPLNGQALAVAQVKADSLRLILRTGNADTDRVVTMLRLSDHYQRRTLNYAYNLDTALTLANQAHTLSQQLQYDKGQQEANFQWGKIYIKQEKSGKAKSLLPAVSGLTRIRLLLELGKNKLRPTFSKEASLDSALWYFSQAEGLSDRLSNQTWRQESQLLTGVAYVLKGECEQGRSSFMRVIQARQRVGDRAGELRAWLRWAATLSSEWNCYNSLDTLSRAFVLAHQLGDKPREAFLWLMVGMKHSIEGNQKRAEQEGLKALAIQKAISYPTFNRAFHALLEENEYLQHVFLVKLLNANGVLAHILETTSRVSEEVFYKLEVIKDLERNGLREDLDWPYFWLGNSYYELGQYAKGVAYYQLSLAVSHRKGKVAVYAGMIRRMAESLTKEGKIHQALQLVTNFTHEHPPLDKIGKINIAAAFGQCYATLKQNKLAEQYYLEAAAWNEKTEGTFIAWLQLSKFYLATNQYAKAIPYLKRVATYAGALPASEKLQLMQLQFKVDSAQTNYPAALHNYQRYTALKDSLLNETTHKLMAELDVRYQTRQREQALKLRQKDIALLTQQSKIQQTQRNALIGGTLLLISLLGLSFNRYRLKQRSNQRLQEQQEQIHHKNQALQRVLEEKERLLKEIHHRVKNNLQIVMSLLNSQADSLHDPSALSAIQQSQHRVQAMALIHQKLYQSEGIARIPMASYIREMAAYLHESYELPQPIGFDLQVESIELDVIQAVPLGLIINEAITNALKYAFPDGRAGTVQVGLCKLSRGEYELVIADDGVGLPADFAPARSRSLGMTLMYGFSEQLGGQLHINGQPGLSIRLRFHDERDTVSLGIGTP
ncbi:histidine kinase dimerization/phosphoacceptor domain -containing protein [Spirosoma spitsbergense]|uniref:histidine kinase dimerization/phosphoacceptor domain -containing protein n=1 Tax=Spirosoma spitsbergense TaxID=431554 RepID=UPI0003740A2D|nr:histidine kinase dimerization/phosphoacceptor domain -containing protein [Spirosoma spitsbergense]